MWISSRSYSMIHEDENFPIWMFVFSMIHLIILKTDITFSYKTLCRDFWAMKLLLLLSFSISLWFCVANAIRGGYDADLGEYPYFVRIGLRFLDDYGRLENTFCCGGCLISKNSVLTAAHCLDQIVGPKKES